MKIIKQILGNPSKSQEVLDQRLQSSQLGELLRGELRHQQPGVHEGEGPRARDATAKSARSMEFQGILALAPLYQKRERGAWLCVWLEEFLEKLLGIARKFLGVPRSS